MHLADGILSSHLKLGLGLNLLGAAGAAIAVRQLRHQPAARFAWAGTLGAFVLAAQAINLPIVPGASAHAIGAGLVTLVLGPSLAIAVLTAVLLVQAILLADGGLTVLGINILNIALLPVLTMHLSVRLFKQRSAPAIVLGTVAGALVSASSLATTLIICAKSSTVWTLAWLTGVQGLAGVAEGVLTWIAVRHLRLQLPQLFWPATTFSTQSGTSERLAALDTPLSFTGTRSRTRTSLRLAAVAVLLVLALVPLASQSPDALEVVVHKLQASEK